MQDPELEQLEALKRRFGYMFLPPNQGLDFYRGWLADFISACEQIDAVLGEDKRGFSFRQTKEKYGAARYYFSTDRATPMRLSIVVGKGVHELTSGLRDEHDVEKRIVEILNDAEVKSSRKCIACGSPATVQEIERWLVCVCEEHHPSKVREFLSRAVLRA